VGRKGEITSNFYRWRRWQHERAPTVGAIDGDERGGWSIGLRAKAAIQDNAACYFIP
jgi:hypothetical protein